MKKHFLMLLLTIFSLFMLIVIGAYVSAANFGAGCGIEWPTCNGSLLPQPTIAAVTEYLHRIFAALSALLLFITTAFFIKVTGISSVSTRLLVISSLIMVFQIILGAIVIFNTIPAELVAFHQGIALLIYGLIVGAAFYSSAKESVVKE
jgi:cytochrome c oxidase assembly protein subunit 15